MPRSRPTVRYCSGQGRTSAPPGGTRTRKSSSIWCAQGGLRVPRIVQNEVRQLVARAPWAPHRRMQAVVIDMLAEDGGPFAGRRRFCAVAAFPRRR